MKTKLTTLFQPYNITNVQQYEKNKWKLKRRILLCKYEMASNENSMVSTENQKQKEKRRETRKRQK